MTQRTAALEQLSMLDASDQPIQFRLDARTRRLGLGQIATIRAQMRARQSDTAAVESYTAQSAPVSTHLGDRAA